MTKATTPRGKSKGKISTAMLVTIIVAVLGCAGTVAAALISGFFLYFTTRAQIDRPIAFTQTAQFMPTEEFSTFDWQSIASIEPDTPCPAVYTPDYLFSGSDRKSWVRDHLFGSYLDNELMYAPLLQHDASSSMRLYLTITNVTPNEGWINLSKDLKISIRFIDEIPLNSEVVQLTDCGGAGEYRYFSRVPLSTDYPEYNVTATSTEADFYTLQPGEFEIFVLEFQCNAPGLYGLQVNIPVHFQGRDETIAYSGFPGFSCPDRVNYSYGSPTTETATGYEVAIYNAEQYEWTGSSYRKTSP